MTNPTPGRTKLKYFLIAVFGALVLSYGLYQMRGLINGPEIIVESPIDGSSSASPLIAIRGRVNRVAKLFLNGELLIPDHTGNFESQLLLAQGYNIIQLDGEDRFGRRVERKLELVLIN
ncbi:MAG: hypothetical protein AAB415_02480 [Patescibacteria group bacterium]